MNNFSFPQYRELLLTTDRIPRTLNPNAQQKRDELLELIKNGTVKTEEVTVCHCGHPLEEKIANIDRFGLPFRSYLCSACGLIVTSPRIAAESLPDYYENFYHILNYGHLHMHNQQALFKLGQGAKIFDILKPHLGSAVLDILEIGAGTGNVLKEFIEAAEGYTINETGTEYSSDCLKECAENGINAVYGDLSTMQKTDKKFDIIILSHVFEHFTDLGEELDKIANLLKDNGLLYIEVPGLMNINRINTYNFDFLEYLIHAHMYNFNALSLRFVLEKGGFKTLSVNESVEGVFKKGGSEISDTSENGSLIKKYLEQLVFCREFLQDGISSFRRGLNNAKEELFNVHRWHEHEKEEAEKFLRWNDSEKDRHAVTKSWLDKEKEIVTEMMLTLDEYFKTPYTKLSLKLKNYKGLRIIFEKYRKRYLD